MAKVDYSGLQQSQTMLEQAKLMESGAISKGLEEGLKPLQEHFENVAKKEEEREKQLKIDQGYAIEFMQDMADTSGLLGKYEPVIAELAKDVKFKLNEIAQDESLNSYEKAAKMKEETDAFNKRASRFARDQEFATAWNEAIGKGTLSNAIDTRSEDYQIASAVAGGNYTVNKDGTYTIGFKSKGEDGIETTKDITFDSKKIREIYLPTKQVSASEVSSTLGELGKAAKTQAQLDQGLQDFASEIGDVKTGVQLLTDGFESTYKSPMALEDAFNNCIDGKDANTKKSCQLKTEDMKGKDWEDLDENTQLEWLRGEAVRVGGRIAKMTFLEKIPPPIKLENSQIMANDLHIKIENMWETNNYAAMKGVEMSGGRVNLIGESKDKKSVVFNVIKGDDEWDITQSKEFLKTRDGKHWLAEHLMYNHTASDRSDALADFQRMFKPVESGCSEGFEKNDIGECVPITSNEDESDRGDGGDGGEKETPLTKIEIARKKLDWWDNQGLGLKNTEEAPNQNKLEAFYQRLEDEGFDFGNARRYNKASLEDQPYSRGRVPNRIVELPAFKEEFPDYPADHYGPQDGSGGSQLAFFGKGKNYKADTAKALREEKAQKAADKKRDEETVRLTKNYKSSNVHNVAKDWKIIEKLVAKSDRPDLDVKAIEKNFFDNDGLYMSPIIKDLIIKNKDSLPKGEGFSRGFLKIIGLVTRTEAGTGWGKKPEILLKKN